MEEVKARVVHANMEPGEDETVVGAHFNCGYKTVVKTAGKWYLRNDKSGHMMRINKELATYAIKQIGAHDETN